MTIKAKWDKLHFEDLDTCIWVFDKGRTIVISEAAHDRVHQDKINNKPFYDGTSIKRKKRSAQ